jgi:hypothetical protein
VLKKDYGVTSQGKSASILKKSGDNYLEQAREAQHVTAPYLGLEQELQTDSETSTVRGLADPSDLQQCRDTNGSARKGQLAAEDRILRNRNVTQDANATPPDVFCFTEKLGVTLLGDWDPWD